MKKLGCAKCGGTKKMKLGGSAVAKAPVNIFGIPQQNLGTSGQSGNMKKGGTTKVHPLVAFQKFNDDRNKKLAKAQLGISTGQKFPARDTSAMKNAFSKDLMDAKYEEAKKNAFNNHKSELNRISQDNLIRQKTAASKLKDYKPMSSIGKMERVSTRKSGGATKALPKAEVGMSTGYLGKPVSQSPSNKYIIDANYRKVATPSNSPRSGKIAVKSSNPGGIPKGIDKPVRTNNSKTSASPIKSANPTREPRIKFGDPMAGIPASKPKPKGRYEDVVESNSTRTKAAVKSVSRPIKSNGPGTPASRTAAIPKSSVKTPVQHTSGYTPKRGATTPVKKTVGPRPSVDEMREANIKKYSVLKSKIAEDKKPKSRNTAAEFKAGMVASPVATVAKKVYGMMKKNGGVVKSKKKK